MADAQNVKSSTSSLSCLSSILSLGLIVFLGFHYRPQPVKLHVSHASLNRSSSTAADTNERTLHYDLTLNMTLRNPNHFYHVYHDYVEVMIYFKNQTPGFGTVVNLKSFKQMAVNTTLLSPSFKLQRPAICQLQVDELGDVFVVKLYFRNRYFNVAEWKARSEFACELKVPSISNTTSGQSIITRTGFDTSDPCTMIDHSFTFPLALRILFCLLIALLFLAFAGCSNYQLAAILALAIVIWLLCTV